MKIVYFLLIIKERKHRNVPESLRKLRAEGAGSVPSQRSLRKQKPVHGG